MANIKLRIEVNENQESEILGDVVNKIGNVGGNNNVSNCSVKANNSGMYINYPTEEFGGTEMLSWGNNGVLKFNSNGILSNEDGSIGYLASEEQPVEFVWGVVREDGTTNGNVKLTFSNAENLKDIVIFGDKKANQFPTEAIIDGQTTIFSDDYKWAINLLNESSEHTIEFTKWNRAGYNACITLIRVMLRYYELNNKEIKSVESLSESTGQPKDIYYGVVPSSGSANINDVNGEIYDMIVDGIIDNSNVNIELWTNDKLIQSHIITDSDYDYYNKTFSIELENDLTLLDSIQYGGMELSNSTDCYSLLYEILTSVGYSEDSIENMTNSEIVCGEHNDIMSVKQYLETIIVEYPYLESATLRETLNKICQISQLNLIEKDNKEIKFVSSRPIIQDTNNIIKIPSKYQYSSIKKDVIVKNNYNSIDISENQLSYDFKDLLKFNYEEFSTPAFTNYNDNVGGENVLVPVIENTKFQNFKDVHISNNNDENLSFLVWNAKYYSEQPSFDESNRYSLMKYSFIDTSNDITKNDMWRIITNTSNLSGLVVNSTRYLVYEGNETKSIVGAYIGQSEEDVIHHFFEGNYPNYTAKIYTFVPQLALVKTGNRIDFYIYKIDFIAGYGTDNLGVKYLSNILMMYDYSGEITIQRKAITSNRNIITYSNMLNNNVTNKINLDFNNELLTSRTLINNYLVSSVLANNILKDYKNGISNVKLTISTSDYCDIYNNKVIDWSKGEVIQVGDILRIDNDNNGTSAFKYKNGDTMYWRVISRNFRYDGKPLIDLGLQEVLIKQPPQSLLFESENEFTLKTGNSQKNWDGTLYYSTNDNDWNEWNGQLISSQNGKLYLRGINNTYISRDYNHRFVLNGTNIKCLGDISNLLDYIKVSNNIEPVMENYCFMDLFCDNLSLIAPPELPMLNLKNSCYLNMFENTNITYSPRLPATNLAIGCYAGMFRNCKNLETISLLPATYLPRLCYNSMYDGCSKIKVQEVQTTECKYKWEIPYNSNGILEEDSALSVMLGDTLSSIRTPEINTTYYTKNQII